MRRGAAGTARLTLVVGAVALAAILAVMLTRPGARAAYDNGRFVERGVVLRPGELGCQSSEFIPAGSPRVRIWVSTAGKPGGPLQVEVRRGAHVVARGRTVGPYRDSAVDVALPAVRRAIAHATVCVRNTSSAQVAVMGSYVPAAPRRLGQIGASTVAARNAPAIVDGRDYAEPIRMRLEWLVPGRRSWLSFAGTVARRASFVRASFAGVWTFWAALAAAAVAALAALGLLAREVREWGR